MFEKNSNETPVYPYEYEHLLLFSESENHYVDVESESGESLEEDLFNHETYKYH